MAQYSGQIPAMFFISGIWGMDWVLVRINNQISV